MEFSTIRRWAVLFFSLLFAILISRVFSGIILTILGLSGIVGFIAGFVLYAVVFFGVLYVFERIFGMSIFRFGGV
jgi:hypothetical protein